AVRGLLDRTGIRCCGAVSLMTPERSLLAKDAARRAGAVAYIKDCIDLVQTLGGDEMTIVPGSVGQVVPEATPDEEWAWAVASLQEINDYGRPRGVRLGLEPINRFETFFINRASQAIALAEAVGDDCGVVLDTFHMALEERDINDAIRAAGDRLVNFHIGENNRFAPGLGTLDWPGIVGTLRAIGYDGALSVEFCPPFDRTPANPFPDQAETDFSGVSEEQMKFLEDHGSNLMSEAFYVGQIKQSADVLRPLIR
ncbi:MAG: sugar phosphate isomerase/epimerase, partial [Phycisphaerae bacterium]|nr:sugar phosphate isomerase/epimerase [Phycisphaerae bacterium]